jgi:N-acetylmuramoyl-L-alanine amidase
MVSLEELGRVFGITVREDPVTRGLAVTARGRIIVLSTTQGLASVETRVVPLPSPPIRSGRTWLVPIEFIERALAVVQQPKLDVRSRSRLIVVGDLRVPRVSVQAAAPAAPGGALQTRVAIEVSPPTPHNVVQEPGRLIVRFEADAVDFEPPTALPPSELLLRVRETPNAPAIALDLGPRFATFRATDALPEGSTQRLTIELVGAADPSQPAIPTTPAPAPPPLLPSGPVPSIRTVVIDPGHGGEEDGAKGPSGTFEKQVTLAVGSQLKAALEAKLGVRVLLTRDDDRTVRLDERAAFANNNKADVFISLHVNASVRPSATGAEVFYLSLDEYSQDARRLALKEGGTVLPTIAGGDLQIEIILWEMAQVQHISESAAFADIIERELRPRVKMSARAIQQAPFRVLVGANMPAVLVEMGFISNPGEERQLNSSTFQQQLVDALVQSVVRFRERLDAGRAVDTGATSQSTPTPAPTPRVR